MRLRALFHLVLVPLWLFASPVVARSQSAPEPTATEKPQATAQPSSGTEPEKDGEPKEGVEIDAQDPVFELHETVVTGTKTEHILELAPVPTQVITSEEIQATATTNVVEVLNQIPDLYVQQNQEFGLGASVVRMQGADPNKVAIVLDGQRFRGGIDGIVDLRDIPIADIEKIEIVRGPASSLYGSDAMAGVINIRTRRGGEEPSLRATAGAGSFSQQIYNVSHGYHVGPVNYFLSAQYDQVAIAQLLGPVSEQYAGDNTDDVQKRSTVYGGIEVPADTQNLRVSADYLKEDNPLSDSNDLTTSAVYTWRPTPEWNLDISGSRYGFQRKNDLPGFIEDVDYADYSTEALLTPPVFNVWGTEHLLISGIRFRSEAYTSPEQVIMGEDDNDVVAPAVNASASQISPFLQDEIFYGERVSLVAGISFDDHSGYGLEVNPRGTFTVRPTDQLRLAVTVGRGFRAPDLLQLYDIDVNNVAIVNGQVRGYAIVGNPNLRAETDVAYNVEAGYLLPLGMRANLVLFRHDFKDLIANVIACPTPTMCNPGFVNPFPELQGPIFSFANVSAALTQGVDVSLDVPLFEVFGAAPSPHSLDLTLGYGYLDTENQSNIPNEEGKELPFRPNNRFLPSLTWSQSDWQSRVRVWGQYEGRIYTDLANTIEGRIGPQWYWNFKVEQGIPGVLDLIGVESPEWLAPTGFFVQGLNVFDTLTTIAGVAFQNRQFAARASFLAGVTYRL